MPPHQAALREGPGAEVRSQPLALALEGVGHPAAAGAASSCGRPAHAYVCRLVLAPAGTPLSLREGHCAVYLEARKHDVNMM